MANKRLPMRNIRETLRLRLVAGLSIRQISRSTRSSVRAVQKIIARAAALELDSKAIELLSDAELAGLIYPKPVDTISHFEAPDCLYLHQELKRKGVTKQLLWDEYRAAHRDRAYRYSQFCTIYRQWLKTQKRSMRQSHRAGEKCFVDYCGHTVPIINPETGEVRDVQVFVGVLGASNYTFAEATHSQKLADWLGSHVRMFEFFGGVPESVVPDNLRSAVSKSCRYDPELNPSYQQLAEHYDIAVLPARPYKPQDKAKAEVAVQIVERWILARLRKLRFFSLAEVNLAISLRCANCLVLPINTPRLKAPKSTSTITWSTSGITTRYQTTSSVRKYRYTQANRWCRFYYRARTSPVIRALTQRGIAPLKHTCQCSTKNTISGRLSVYSNGLYPLACIRTSGLAINSFDANTQSRLIKSASVY